MATGRRPWANLDNEWAVNSLTFRVLIPDHVSYCSVASSYAPHSRTNVRSRPRFPPPLFRTRPCDPSLRCRPPRRSLDQEHRGNGPRRPQPRSLHPNLRTKRGVTVIIPLIQAYLLFRLSRRWKDIKWIQHTWKL